MNNWTTFKPPDDLSTAPTVLGSNQQSEISLNTTYFGITTTLNNSNVTYSNSTTTAPNDQLLVDVSSYLWKVLSPLLFIVGIFGNILSVIILRRMRFWKKPSLFFLVPLAFTDTTVLCVGLSRYWVKEMFDSDLRTYSQAGCKINLFVVYISMQFSSWILVCFTFERFLKTNFPFRYIRIMTVKKEVIALVVIFVFLVCVDGHYFGTNGLTNRTGSLECSSLTNATFYFDEYIFVYIDLAFLSIVPAVLMLIMNICIVRVLRRSIQFLRTSSSGSGAANRQRYSIKVTKMVLMTSSYFILATLPICLYYIVDSYTHTNDDVISAQKDLAWSVVYIFQYSNYAMNFFFYTVANDKFRLHVLSIIKCRTLERFSRRKSSAYSAQQTSTFRITSEDSETMAGVSSEGEWNDNHVSPSTNNDTATGSDRISERMENNYSVFPSTNGNSVTANNSVSFPSLSGKIEKSRKLSSLSWSKRVQEFNSAVPNPSVSDATV